MKKLILAAMAVAAATPAAANSSNSGTTQVAVQADLAKACAFGPMQTPALMLSAATPYASTQLPYYCNFVGRPTVTITSANGGLGPNFEAMNNGAYTPLAYRVRFGDGATPTSGSMGLPASDFVGAGLSSTTSLDGWVNTSTANVTNYPVLALYLVDAPQIAGSYTDVLTVNIAP